MQTWIKDQLDRVDALYPPERLARSRERWERLWRGEPLLDRYPFVYNPLTFNYYDALHTPEQRLRASLDEFTIRGAFDDDFIPTLFPGCRASTIPGMFGALETIVDDDVSCERVIRDVADIAQLPEPDILPGSVAQGWLDMQRYFLDETEGRLPIHVADMQGPADVCGKLWGYDAFFVAAYTDPDAFHELMHKVTDAFILLWERQRRLLGDHFVPTHLWAWSWAPPDIGAALSADSLVMISDDFYREFYQPHFERIGAAFGGLSIHSCGQFGGLMQALCRTEHLKAVNTSQMTLPDLLAAGFNTDLVPIAFTDMQRVAETFELAHRHALRLDLTVARDWPAADGTIIPPDAWTGEQRAAFQHDHETILKAASG